MWVVERVRLAVRERRQVWGLGRKLLKEWRVLEEPEQVVLARVSLAVWWIQEQRISILLPSKIGDSTYLAI